MLAWPPHDCDSAYPRGPASLGFRTLLPTPQARHGTFIMGFMLITIAIVQAGPGWAGPPSCHAVHRHSAEGQAWLPNPHNAMWCKGLRLEAGVAKARCSISTLDPFSLRPVFS